MRNIRALAMIVVSLIAGFGALTLATRWLNAQSVIATNAVVVAAVDIKAGQPISEPQLRTIEWPVGSVPDGAFKMPADLKDRVSKTAISRDEPILESRLAAPGTRGGMAAIIKDGMRAITVRVNDVVGVAGFALPGTFVDIMVNINRRSPTGSDTTVSKIVLERILVLAVAQEAGRDDTAPKVVNAVTLEVSPLEAEKIDLARSVGTLSLVLRNSIDADSIKTAGATSDLLLGQVKPAPSAPQAARPSPRIASDPVPERICVDAWNGSTKKRECF